MGNEKKVDRADISDKDISQILDDNARQTLAQYEKDIKRFNASIDKVLGVIMVVAMCQ